MNNQDQQTKITHLLYKMVSCTGYLLDLFSEVDQYQLKSPIFTMSLKRDAQKFKAGLERVEAFVTGTIDKERTDVIDQISESYHLVDRLLDIHIQAERKLKEEARLMMVDEVEAVLKKYGMTIE